MGYIVYVHTDSRVPVGEDTVYYSTVLVANSKGSDVVRYDTYKDILKSDNVYLRAIQSYKNALDFVYKNQGELIKNGVSDVIIVLDNATVRKWIEVGAPIKYRDELNRIHNIYGFGGSKGINITVGLGGKKLKNIASKYTYEKYVRKNLNEIGLMEIKL